MKKQKPRCKICGGKIENRDIYVPGDMIWLVPAQPCLCCGAAHKNEDQTPVRQNGFFVFWETNKITLKNKTEILELFSNISVSE